ncbi:MAG TPA: hypothetical protein PLW31_04485 [Bacteroidales bacterium]|nr:hypothetical protein [Bacteroidales bacterium]HOX77276.1 hypothetical protein [Bacteroidales bacterium]
MKKLFSFFLVMFFISSLAFSQSETVEKGDKEFSANGFLQTTVGGGSSSASGYIGGYFG